MLAEGSFVAVVIIMLVIAVLDERDHDLPLLAMAGIVTPLIGSWMLMEYGVPPTEPLDGDFFGGLSGAVFGLAVAYVLALRFHGTLPAALEIQRRFALGSFAVGGGVATVACIAMVAFEVNDPLARRIVGGYCFLAMLLLCVFILLLAAFPQHGQSAPVTRNVATTSIIQVQPPAALVFVAVVVLAALGGVGAAVTDLPWWAMIGGWVLVGLAVWVVRAPATPHGTPWSMLDLRQAALVLVGWLMITGLVAAVADQPPTGDVLRALGGVVAGLLAGALALFAAGRPGKPSITASVGWWTGLGGVAALGLVPAVLAAMGTAGAYSFWLPWSALVISIAGVFVLGAHDLLQTIEQASPAAASDGSPPLPGGSP